MKRLRLGFTLIELLVVILILAILATLIVPKVLGRADQAKVAKAQADLKTLSDSLQNYHADNDYFPSTEDGLGALRQAPANAKNWRGPYITQDIPLDPWENEYHYTSPGPNSEDSFVIESYGKDGAPGGTDLDADITTASE